MAFDRTKPADTDYISASAANLRENFRALAEDTRLYGTGSPESSAGQNGWRYVDTATGDEYLKVNNAWIKKTDLAELIATLLGEDVYKQSNIIGTVGQSSGIPTGAVIERGNNANGEYIKFTDGTMICSWMPSFSNVVCPPKTAIGPYTWTFPAEFASLGAAMVEYIGANGIQIEFKMMAVSTSALSSYAFNEDSNVTLTTQSGDKTSNFALGRWF